MDEIASLVLASRPVAAIVDVSAIDTNPPGYFLLLKAWLKLGRALGSEPGILWARSLGVLAWIGLVLIAWTGGRKLLGPREGAVLTVAVAGSSFAAVQANDARGYSIASVALFACFLILLLSYRDEIAEEGRASIAWQTSIRRWLLYAACATAALWTQVLSVLVLGCLMLLWAVLTIRAHALRSRFAALGAAAHLLTLLMFFPWLLNLKGQVASLQTSAPTWMTPATWFNLGSVFWYWYPFGRIGEPGKPLLPFFPLLGVLSILIPLAMASVGIFKIRDPGRHRQDLEIVAFSGLGVSLLFVILLWTLKRLALAPVFHAPRYPALTAALWASGLAGLAGLAGERCRLRGLCAWGAIAPWLACAVLGQASVPRVETRGGLQAELSQLAASPPGKPLYVMPSELIPFYRRSLAGYRVQRIEDLACGLRGSEEAWVLNLNPWRIFDRTRDLIAQKILSTGTLAGTVQRVSFPATAPLYELYHLSAVHQDTAAALCRQGIQPAGRGVPRQAVSSAFPEEQRFTDGWSYPEVNAERVVYRWAAAPAVTVRFDRPLPAGDYILHYHGYRSAQPKDVVEMTFRYGGRSQTVLQPQGEISLQLPVHLESGTRHPVLTVEHPTWKPGSGDTRTLGSALLVAWIEPTGK